MATGKRGKGSTAGTKTSQPKSGGKVVPLRTTGKSKSQAVTASSASTTARPASGPTHEQIAQRAEAIWRKRGCPAGQDAQNWHEAEAQLRAELGIE
jgi:hypothetical protein